MTPGNTLTLENSAGGSDMEKAQDYFGSDYESDEGHIDTRSRNFECDNPDDHLGCDLRIDVAG